MRKFYTALFITVLFIDSSDLKSENLDSLIKSLSVQKPGLEQYSLLSKIAIAYSDSNYSRSLEYWQMALGVAEKLNQRNLVADSYHQIGFSYHKMGEPDLALKNLAYASDIYKHLDDKKNLAGVHNDIGLIYRNWGKYDNALEQYINALKLFDEVLDVEGSAMVSNSIGQIYYYRENYPKAIDYFKRYFDVNLSLKNSRAVAGAANNIASAYLEVKKYDDALSFFLKALKIYDSLNVRVGVAIIRDNIGSLFYQKQQYDEALLYHKNALAIFKELESPVRISNTLKNIGQVYIKQGKIQIAIERLNESLTYAQNAGQVDAIKDIYKILSDAHQINGNFKQAYYYLNSYDALKDSLINIESIEKIESLQAEYDAERRENELSSINHRLATQQRIFYAFSGFMAILLIAFFLLIRENRAKNRAIAGMETVKSKMLEKLSATCTSMMSIIKHDSSPGDYFSEWWEVKPTRNGFAQGYTFYFKVNNTIFAHLLVMQDAGINAELINITVFNFVSGVLRNQPEKVVDLDKAIAQLLAADPLTASFNPHQYQLIPILIDNGRILNLAGEHLAIWQKGSLLAPNNKQWQTLRNNDIVYIYTVEPADNLKNIRKIFGTFSNIEFTNQKEVAQNYLETTEMSNSTFIFALKV